MERIKWDEPQLSGFWNYRGRNYMREPLDCTDAGYTDMILIWGARTGKTRIWMGFIAYKLGNEISFRALWVMPNKEGPSGARRTMKTRMQPMLRMTLPNEIPTGADRHNFSGLSMMFTGGSILDVTGTGSDANLAGNPCDVVIQDETEKFTHKSGKEGHRESHPSNQADQRTKEFAMPFRGKSSTPNLETGIGWQCLVAKSDLRRRYVPCPHCAKFVVFAWMDADGNPFTVLPKVNELTGEAIPLAYSKWETVKDENGKPDIAHAMKTAHYECPHCSGKILDRHKVEMDEHGKWVATRRGAPGWIGFHLPSMYSVSRETSVAEMVKRFLLARDSAQGLQDFINSDLAEPYVAQDLQGRKDLTSSIEAGAEWKKIMSVDVQAKSPYFWFIVRAWGSDKCVGLDGGPLETWDDVRTMQKKHQIVDSGVIIDSGYGSMENAGVYRECAQVCEFQVDPLTGKGLGVGWTPAKSYGGRKTWTEVINKETGERRTLPFINRRIDPFMGTPEAARVEIDFFEWCLETFLDVLDKFRTGDFPGIKWAVAPEMLTEEYQKHMNALYVKQVVKYGKIVDQWTKRGFRWPDHMLKCEAQGVAFAASYGLFPLKTEDVK